MSNREDGDLDLGLPDSPEHELLCLTLLTHLSRETYFKNVFSDFYSLFHYEVLCLLRRLILGYVGFIVFPLFFSIFPRIFCANNGHVGFGTGAPKLER